MSRTKYFDTTANQWKYADSPGIGGGGSLPSGTNDNDILVWNATNFDWETADYPSGSSVPDGTNDNDILVWDETNSEWGTAAYPQGTISSGSTGFATGGDVFTELETKQNTLTAGAGISIINNTISLASNELPGTYQQVEWLKSTGTQYIDTGYHPNENTKWVLGWEPLGWNQSGFPAELGNGEVYESSQVESFAISATTNGRVKTEAIDSYSSEITNYYNVSGSVVSDNVLKHKTEYSLDSYHRRFSVNGDYKYNISGPSATATYGLILFGVKAKFEDPEAVEGYLSGGTFYEDSAHTTAITPDISTIYYDIPTNIYYKWDGTAFSSEDYMIERMGTSKIYYHKIYEGDTLVQDFVPCYRKSDGVAGMYDKVSQTFFTNDGTGAFEVGDDTNPQIIPVVDSNVGIFRLEMDNNSIQTVETVGEIKALANSGKILVGIGDLSETERGYGLVAYAKFGTAMRGIEDTNILGILGLGGDDIYLSAATDNDVFTGGGII